MVSSPCSVGCLSPAVWIWWLWQGDVWVVGSRWWNSFGFMLWSLASAWLSWWRLSRWSNGISLPTARTRQSWVSGGLCQVREGVGSEFVAGLTKRGMDLGVDVYMAALVIGGGIRDLWWMVGGCGSWILLLLLGLLQLCCWFWAFIFYFQVIIDERHATSSF